MRSFVVTSYADLVLGKTLRTLLFYCIYSSDQDRDTTRKSVCIDL